MHHLGIPMGRGLNRKSAANPSGYYEDIDLRKIAKDSLRSIWDPERFNTTENRVRLFREWLNSRAGEGPVIGGKYPRLCGLVNELWMAVPGMRAVVPERDPVECARSMKVRWAPFIDVEKRAEEIRKGLALRDYHLNALEIPTYRFQYLDLVQRPRAIITAIAEFCGITPLPGRIEAAVAFVDPELNHFTKG